MAAPELERPDATEIGDARRRIEQLVSGLPGADSAERSFEQPWEIRAFAMAVAAYQQRQFEWSEFQLSLISSIKDWEAAGGADEEDPWSYYEHWVAALESVLSGSGLLSESALDEQTKQVLALPANRNHHEAHREPIAIDPAR
jgi:nitrile hydratase accessory protein